MIDINNRKHTKKDFAEEIVALRKQRQDLLEANNRYLERARQAEAQCLELEAELANAWRLEAEMRGIVRKFDNMGLFARLVWALKGGAP